MNEGCLREAPIERHDLKSLGPSLSGKEAKILSVNIFERGGYLVSTVGRDERLTRAYARQQPADKTAETME
jgi:hypothetical protein